MKKTFTIFIAALQCVVATSAMAAISVKKAAPVATQQADKMTSVTSLLPTVINLYGTVQQLKQQQKALTDECIPSRQEIDFVDKTMKEWARTGVMSAEEVQTRLGRTKCSSENGYAAAARVAAATEDATVCFNYFGGSGNEGMIWYEYPRVGIVNDLCDDGTTTCKDKKTVSDIYDIFSLITFDTVDYEKDEVQMVGKLMDKIQKCSDSKLSARQKEMWGSFLTTTISSIGQKQNTGNIMDMVGSVTGSIGGGGGIGGALGGLGNIASGLFGQ